MRDQAESLRMRIQNHSDNKQAKVISIMSGKGGVGKSNFALNYSIALCQKGTRVLLFDLDVGMGNIDILMGFTADRTIVDVINKDIPIHDVIRKGPENLSFVAGGTGLTNIVQMSEEKMEAFLTQFEGLLLEYEYIIFDFGAGVHEDSLKWLLATHEIIVITTPEPTSITDCYAAIKYVHYHDDTIPMHVLLNRVEDILEGKETLQRLQNATKHFLNKEVNILGMVPNDTVVGKSVRQQVPFIINQPNSKASLAINQIANSFYESDKIVISLQEKPTFISRLRKFLFGG